MNSREPSRKSHQSRNTIFRNIMFEFYNHFLLLLKICICLHVCNAKSSQENKKSQALTPPSFINLRHICKKHFFFQPVELKKKKKQTEFCEQMTSNLAFTERNVQKANAYRFPCIYRKDTVAGCPWFIFQILVRSKNLWSRITLPNLYVCVWLVNTLTSTVPIGSLIICMRSTADICEQWERNVSIGSADVSGAGTRDEPLRRF